MSGPFADAVTKAVRLGDGDSWDLWFYMDGNWPQERQQTYRTCRESALGPEWMEALRSTVRMERGVVADVMHREQMAGFYASQWSWEAPL